MGTTPTSLTTTGDLADTGYASGFTVVFDPIAHQFTLSATVVETTLRQVSVFVGVANGLAFPVGNFNLSMAAMINVTHTIR